MNAMDTAIAAPSLAYLVQTTTDLRDKGMQSAEIVKQLAGNWQQGTCGHFSQIASMFKSYQPSCLEAFNRYYAEAEPEFWGMVPKSTLIKPGVKTVRGVRRDGGMVSEKPYYCYRVD